jgi:hypothetical protein
MKMHELSSESSTKRINLSRRTHNNSLTTDSCSQSPSSFENLVPMKSNYIYHHSTPFQQNYF